MASQPWNHRRIEPVIAIEPIIAFEGLPMTRLYCICVALLIALLLAVSAAGLGPAAIA